VAAHASAATESRAQRAQASRWTAVCKRTSWLTLLSGPTCVVPEGWRPWHPSDLAHLGHGTPRPWHTSARTTRPWHTSDLAHLDHGTPRRARHGHGTPRRARHGHGTPRTWHTSARTAWPWHTSDLAHLGAHDTAMAPLGLGTPGPCHTSARTTRPWQTSDLAHLDDGTPRRARHGDGTPRRARHDHGTPRTWHTSARMTQPWHTSARTTRPWNTSDLAHLGHGTPRPWHTSARTARPWQSVTTPTVVHTPYQFETICSIPRIMCLIYNRLYNKIQVTRTHPGASPPPKKTTFCRTCHLSKQTISQRRSITPETTFCRTCHLSEQTLSQGWSPPPAQRLLRFPVAPRVRSA